MEHARRNFPCGWPDVGLNGVPPLDPLQIDHVTVEAGGIGTSLRSELYNLVIRGLQQFVIEDITFNDLNRSVRYVYTVQRMDLVGRHSTRGSMLLIPVVNGAGPMTVQMLNSRISGTAFWSTDTNGHVIIIGQDTWVDSQVTVRLEGFGLMTNSINNAINDAIPEYLADPEFQLEINDIINSIMLPAIEQFIYQKTPQDVTNSLANHAANPSPDRCF